MSELYDKVEEFVNDSFNGNVIHFERTVHWIKELKPDADEALLIAGISHDIERAFRKKGDSQEQTAVNKGFHHPEFFKSHEEIGARIIGEFLEKEGADEHLIQRVKSLILKHEEGGDDDQNLLKDADSVSFFENNIDHFLDAKVKEVGKQKIKKKFYWMYKRITSEKAKQIAKDWYQKAMDRIESL